MSRGTASRIIGRELTACIMLVCAAILTKSAHAEPQANSADTTAAEIGEIWNRFVTVNKVWLDPRPKQLSYVVVAEPRNNDVRTDKRVNRVWIDGDDARWEMDCDEEFAHPRTGERYKLSYTLVCTDGKEMYLRAPFDSMLNSSKPARDIHPLRQGITWYTAVHAVYQAGLPHDCRIVGRQQVEGGENVVLEMNLPESRSTVGLGLYHVFLGQSTARIGHVRVHLRLPEYVPVKEEFLDQNATIEYNPTFLAFGEQHAPSRIRYISHLSNNKPWVLEGQFQKVDGEWLMDKAYNIQDGKVIMEMHVSKVSTAAVDRSLFIRNEDDPN